MGHRRSEDGPSPLPKYTAMVSNLGENQRRRSATIDDLPEPSGPITTTTNPPPGSPRPNSLGRSR